MRITLIRGLVFLTSCVVGWAIASPAVASAQTHEFINRAKCGKYELTKKSDLLWALDNGCLKGDHRWWAGHVIKQLGHRTQARDFASLRDELASRNFSVFKCSGEVRNLGYRTLPGGGQQSVRVIRKCYEGEWMLGYAWTPAPGVVTAPPVAVVSLTCLNPQEQLQPPDYAEIPLDSSTTIWISKGGGYGRPDTQMSETRRRYPGATPRGRATQLLD